MLLRIQSILIVMLLKFQLSLLKLENSKGFLRKYKLQICKKNLKKWINCCIVVNTTSIFIFFKFLNLIFDDIYLSDNIII